MKKLAELMRCIVITPLRPFLGEGLANIQEVQSLLVVPKMCQFLVNFMLGDYIEFVLDNCMSVLFYLSKSNEQNDVNDDRTYNNIILTR